MRATPKIDLVWFNAGGGHRAAAQALEQGITLQGLPWCVRHVQLTQVLDPAAYFRRVMGFEPEDFYNKRLATGFTLGLLQELKLLQSVIGACHAGLVERLARHWEATAPDLVVSLIPNFNRALHDSLALARPGVPFVTVLTDLADHPPSFWVEPGTAQHVVCGTAHAVDQAFAAGHAPERVHRVNGMLLRPDFHADEPFDRVAERQAVGLDAGTPTGLVLFGGTGSRVMKQIARRLPHTPLILLCGHNEVLAAELRVLPTDACRVVVGHTSEVAGWMRLADFFIGKPGPGSLSEAVQMGLPVIVTRNAWTLPQERWNTDWVRSQGLGVVHPDFSTVRQAVDEITGGLDRFRCQVARVENRAVREVPALLRSLLDAVSVPASDSIMTPTSSAPARASEIA